MEYVPSSIRSVSKELTNKPHNSLLPFYLGTNVLNIICFGISVSRLKYLIHARLNPCDRLSEDIGMRSLALSEKGKVARVLDKIQDLQEAIGLAETSGKRFQSIRSVPEVLDGHGWASLTGVIDVSTVVHARPTDRGFLSLVSDFAKPVAGSFKPSFNVLLKLH